VAAAASGGAAVAVMAKTVNVTVNLGIYRRKTRLQSSTAVPSRWRPWRAREDRGNGHGGDQPAPIPVGGRR
jgi:hypothetical protein